MRHHGVGAVLAHVMSEKNYSELDKEALAIICDVNRFYHYIYGRKFNIMIDHKPLIGLFGHNKVIHDGALV